MLDAPAWLKLIRVMWHGGTAISICYDMQDIVSSKTYFHKIMRDLIEQKFVSEKSEKINGWDKRHYSLTFRGRTLGILLEKIS